MTMTQQLSKPQPVRQIAKRVVNECLQVQPNEQVTVFTWDHTLDYANSVALEFFRMVARGVYVLGV